MKSETERQWIQKLGFKDKIHCVYLVKSKSVLKDKNGKSFLCFTLKDRTGSLTAMAWENVEVIEKSFEMGDLVLIKGHVQNYQDKKQIVVHGLNRVEGEGVDMRDYIQGADVEPEVMLNELKAIVSEVRCPYIKQLLEGTLGQKEVLEKLMQYPAAKSIHHARVAGLLEHILSIAKTMQFMAKQYVFLDQDLLIFGAIFHDIGKLWELDISNGYQYTTRGRLVGHMAIACELLDERSKMVLGFPQELKDKLKHIILSHHGRLEYGSPKRPKFLEALVVAMIDDLDSKVASMRELITEEAEEEDWTRYDKNFDRYIYRR